MFAPTNNQPIPNERINRLFAALYGNREEQKPIQAKPILRNAVVPDNAISHRNRVLVDSGHEGEKQMNNSTKLLALLKLLTESATETTCGYAVLIPSETMQAARAVIEDVEWGAMIAASAPMPENLTEIMTRIAEGGPYEPKEIK